MNIDDTNKWIICISIWILVVCPNISRGEKIYEVFPNGVGLNSLAGVMDDIRRNHSSMDEDVVVLLKDGCYLLESTLSFDIEDGGTKNYSVTYKAESGANPIISGGHVIDDWEIDSKDIGVAKTFVDSSYVRNLYADGKRLKRSNHEAFFAEGVYRNDTEGKYGLIIDNKDLPLFEKIDGLEINHKLHWRQYYFVVDSIVGRNQEPYLPEEKSLIIIKNFDLALNLVPSVKGGSENPFYFENAYELMAEDEFYFQPSNQYLYYRYSPEGIENITVADLDCIVKVISSKSDERVKNLIFDGISFCYSSYDYPSIGGFIPLQSSHLINTIQSNRTYTLMPGAIQIENAENIKFSSCSFKHLGGNGICIINNTDSIIIDNNKFTDISGSAISMSDYSHAQYDDHILPIVNTVITNNYIKDIGVEFASCCGIEAFYVENLTIANNELYDMPYTGISVGFGWSMEPTSTRTVKVLNNKIIGDTQKCFDGGAIYSLSHFGGEGLLIEGNYIDEITSKPCKDFVGAIYTDEGSSNVRINNNVVMTERNWFFYHRVGKVEVDTTYVLPQNHDEYGGVDAYSGGTEINYVGNGEHIFDLPCEKADDIINNAGIKMTGSDVTENKDIIIRDVIDSNFIIKIIPNGIIISNNKEVDCREVNVKIHDINGNLRYNIDSETNTPINISCITKGFYIIKISSGFHSEIFKILL